jgi:hypothetical protein
MRSLEELCEAARGPNDLFQALLAHSPPLLSALATPPPGFDHWLLGVKASRLFLAAPQKFELVALTEAF